MSLRSLFSLSLRRGRLFVFAFHDAGFHLWTEMPHQTLNRPRRRIAKGANGMPFDLVADLQQHVDLGYVGETLSSLDIHDAVGTYDFDGLTSFGFNLWAIFPDNVVLDIEFQQMTISVIPAPATFAVLALMGLGLRRRRRRVPLPHT